MPCVCSSTHLFCADIFLPTLSHRAHTSVHFLLSCSIFIWSLYCLVLTTSCLWIGRVLIGAAAFTMSGLCHNQLSHVVINRPFLVKQCGSTIFNNVYDYINFDPYFSLESIDPQQQNYFQIILLFPPLTGRVTQTTCTF